MRVRARGLPARRLEVQGQDPEPRAALVVADMLPVQLDLLREGLSLGQVGQRPFEMGYKSMHMLLDARDGKKLEDPTYTGLDVCTPQKVDTCTKPSS